MDRTCLVSVRPTSVWTWQTNSPLSAEDTAVMLNSDPDGLKDPVTEYRESFFSRLGPADRTFRILLLNCNSGFQHFIILRTVMMAIFKRVFPCSKNWIECSWCENATLSKAELGWLIWPQMLKMKYLQDNEAKVSIPVYDDNEDGDRMTHQLQNKKYQPRIPFSRQSVVQEPSLCYI